MFFTNINEPTYIMYFKWGIWSTAEIEINFAKMKRFVKKEMSFASGQNLYHIFKESEN